MRSWKKKMVQEEINYLRNTMTLQSFVRQQRGIGNVMP